MAVSKGPEPFAFHTSPEELEDLRLRLARTRWTDALDAGDWCAGTSLGYLRELVEYWLTAFDWPAHEARLNQWPHFRLAIDGLRIHFVYQRGRGPRPLPLLLTHGWPGSFLEMEALIPLLADPASHGGNSADAFDVVVPSIPGYGFSDPPRQPGMSNAHVANLWVGLMERLGYESYGLQGGDWGAGISSWLARRHPTRVVGLHLNYVPGSYQPAFGPRSPPLSSREQAFLVEKQRWAEEEGAYSHLQRSRPQTAAFGLNDSPVGLAAWLVEKLRAWSDCDGNLERRFTKKQILTHISLYWFTQTIHSSMRLYLESASTPLRLEEGERISPPTALTVFPKEAPSPPKEWVERGYNLQRWTEMPRGGHFAAMEEPALLAEDIRAFFRPLRRPAGPEPVPKA
jgi:pimeloyl-ACP methyl ester carboxylesterase